MFLIAKLLDRAEKPPRDYQGLASVHGAGSNVNFSQINACRLHLANERWRNNACVHSDVQIIDIGIPASLNGRLQDYCAAKRIKTERRVFLVLLENFLEEEGF